MSETQKTMHQIIGSPEHKIVVQQAIKLKAAGERVVVQARAV